MLLMSQTLEELLLSRDTINSLLTQLGFAINLKKSILAIVQQIEFLGLEMKDVRCLKMQSKVVWLSGIWQSYWGYLTSTILPAKHSNSFPATDINTSSEKKYDLQTCDYSGLAGSRRAIMIDNQHENLQWKIFLNRTLSLTMFSVASKKGWGASSQWIIGVWWSSMEKACHTNVLKFKTVRLGILSFTKLKKLKLIHLWIDNITGLSYLLNIGGIQNKHLIEIFKKYGVIL